MTKRVLAFLLVLALVVSLVPTVVLAEEAAATPGYTVVLQKALPFPAQLTLPVMTTWLVMILLSSTAPLQRSPSLSAPARCW